MSALTLAQRAEILKLARLLGTEAGDLDALAQLDATVIRSLRQRATAVLFDADRARFQKLAGASRLLPVSVLAVIVKKVFGPLLCARIAGLIAPARAIEIAARLEIPFLVEVCLELDPRSAQELVAGFPVPSVVPIACELARRGELVTMGRFVDAISLEAVDAVMKAIDDDATLLTIAFFAEEPARLDEIVELLPQARLKRIILRAATGAPDVWGEALALMSGVGAGLRAKLAAITGAMELPVLDQIVRNTQLIDAWDTLLPIVATMSIEQQERLLPLLNVIEPAQLARVRRSAGRAGLSLS